MRNALNRILGIGYWVLDIGNRRRSHEWKTGRRASVQRIGVWSAALGLLQSCDLLHVERRAHQVPFGANLLTAAVEKAPESHSKLDLAKAGLHGTFPPPIEFAMAWLVHDPTQFAFSQVARLYPDEGPSIDCVIMAARTRRRVRGLVGPHPIRSTLADELKSVTMETDKLVLVGIVAETVQLP